MTTDPATQPRRVALVSCGASKLDYRAPAQHLYTSGLFRLSARYAAARFDAWYIISAFYDLVEPERELSPYDRSMRELSKDRREAWAIRVAGRLRHFEAGCVVPGTRMLGGPLASTRLTLLAGAEYAAPLAPHIDADEPLKGLPIGRRLEWLRQRVNGAPEDPIDADGGKT